MDLDFPVECSFDGRKWYSGRCRDFNLSGIFMEAEAHAPEKTKIFLKLYLSEQPNSEPVKIIARVIRVGLDPRLQLEGMEVKFETISGDGEKALHNFFKLNIPKTTPTETDLDDDEEITVSGGKASLDDMLDADSKKFYESIVGKGSASKAKKEITPTPPPAPASWTDSIKEQFEALGWKAYLGVAAFFVFLIILLIKLF